MRMTESKWYYLGVAIGFAVNAAAGIVILVLA